MDRPFAACAPDFVQRSVERMVAFRRLPERAERDVLLALDRVSPDGQTLLIQLAEDARVPDRVAVERLSCLWVSAAAINLADDLADGDCDYLESRVGPGVSFLLQSLAMAFAARSEISARCLEEHAVAMVRAAAGQSLEVRREGWDASRYLTVAELIAGEQYAAHLRLLWDGTEWESEALTIGRALGTVGLVLSDITSADERLGGLSLSDRSVVLQHCCDLVATIEGWDLVGLNRFLRLARGKLPRADQAGTVGAGAI